MKEALQIILREQELQQIRTDFAYEKFKEAKKEDEDYNKIASEYYYQNGMNNQLLVLRNLIESEMNKNE